MSTFQNQVNADQLDKNVLFVLSQHVGKQNAIPRWEMAEKIFNIQIPRTAQNDDNVQDREIRYAIGRLRGQGYLICDLGDGNGRYLAETETEFWEMYNAYVKPIRTRAGVARAMKLAAQKKFPNLLQPALFDFERSIDEL